MCEECRVFQPKASLALLRDALAALDAEHQHAAAAFVDHAIEIVERNLFVTAIKPAGSPI